MRSFSPGRTFTGRVLLLCALCLFQWFYGFSQDVEPQEPEIVLPNVILELEDLKVEEVTAKLPKEELEPFEIDFPLPELEESAMEELPGEMVLPPAQGLPLKIQKEGKFFVAEGILGIGTLNHVLSSISLYRYEKQPEGKLLFSHEVVDGFSEEPVGSGFHMRDDRIAGSLFFRLRRLEIGLDGSFEDGEKGLQGRGDFYSKVNRHASGSGELEYRVSERFSLKGDIDASTTTQLLTASGTAGPEAEKTAEYLISSSLEGRYHFRRGFFGMEPRIAYRGGGPDDSLALARTEVRGFFGADLSAISVLEGSLGWFWSKGGQNLIPFSLTLSAYPSDLFSFRGSFGYRVQEYDLSNILPLYPMVDAPTRLTDSSGWYGEMGSHVYLTQGLTVSLGVLFQDSDAMPTSSAVLDGTSGLFPFEQREALQLTSDIGLRWNRSKNFTAYLSLKSELMDKPEFFPRSRLNLELTFMQEKGKYGGWMTSELYTGVNDFIQAPLLNLQGFYRVADSIRVGAQVDDLLYPLLDAPRYSIYPYVDMGLKLTFKTYITF